MKRIWLLAILLGVWPIQGTAQTTEELLDDGQNTENVLLHSMGYDRKSYSPLDQINRSNVKRLVPIWNASLMNNLGELAAPVIYDGVMYVINGAWTFAIDVETGRQIWRTPVVLQGETQRAAKNRGAPTLYEGKLFRGDGRQSPARLRYGDRGRGVETEVRGGERGLLRDRRADRGQRRLDFRDVWGGVDHPRVPRRVGP